MAARTFGRGLRVIQAYRQSDSEPLPIEELSEALRAMHGAGLTELDTARSYNHGITGRESEALLGAALATLPPAMAAQFTISTKLSPGQGIDPEPERGFRHGAVLAQGDASRSSLGRDSVLVLYLHSPDLETDLDETLSAVNELHKQGFFQDFGISNFPAWQVMQVYMRCKALGYCLPAVYQGVYNPLGRQVETDILPCIRMLGMRFNAYSPWAAGLLQQPWADGSDSELRGHERGRYYGSDNSSVGMDGNSKTASIARTAAAIPTALSRIDKACRAESLSIAEATARWHFHHSKLMAGDGVIMGAASVEQLEENVGLVSKASASPLPPSVAEAFEAAWMEDLAGPAEYPAMGHMPMSKL